ncbi:Glycosyltransferase involved in cell wall bisynthesis [Ruminococcaceae bacterium FB2012]|nr:Glycosyltransferase involved in cell wall bisynthesis [Ruminococcaceae bacterium FB2012]
MRIGIDASLFKNSSKTGIPTAVENVLKSWSKNHPENEYYLFSRKKIYLDAELKENWHLIRNPIAADRENRINNKLLALPFALLYKFVIAPIQRMKYRTDLFWAPDYFMSVKCGAKKYAVSVYDLAMLRFKDTVTLKSRIHHKLGLPIAAHNADKIVTISRASARDIHELLGVRKNKIAISYLGGLNGSAEGKQPYTPDMKPELDIKGRFILFISTIEPRKNIMTIIKAFEKYLDEYGDSDLYLVLAGGRGWRCDDIYKAAGTSRYKDRIIMPGYISAEEKQYLLENASLFAYPSLYEGFGIPVLEAFDKELPVVTTRVSSLPEVGGDAAFYIDDPYDAEALKGQFRKVLTLSDKEMSGTKAKMKRQLKKFSWEKNAEEIMSLFKRLVK